MFLNGCYLNPTEAVQHLVKDFNLGWQTDPESQALYANVEKDEFGGIKLIDKKIFAVGYDEEFIVVLQQPDPSATDTVYHILDIREFDRFWSPSENLYSFQIKQEFLEKKQELGVADLEIQTITAPEI